MANCYANALRIAETLQLKTVAFPNISTGVYGYPKEEAARVAIEDVRRHAGNAQHVEEVRFVCFDAGNYEIYRKILG